MNTSEVLNRAADLIEERGWTQGPDGWDRDERGSLCLEGGMAAAMGIKVMTVASEFYLCPAYAAVADSLDRKPLPPTAPMKDALWMWNDADDRTAEQVIATLRAAAVIAAARESATQPAPVAAVSGAVVGS